MPRVYYDEDYMSLSLKQRTQKQAMMCGFSPQHPESWPLKYLHYMDFIFMCYTRETYNKEWQKFMNALRKEGMM